VALSTGLVIKIGGLWLMVTIIDTFVQKIKGISKSFVRKLGLGVFKLGIMASVPLILWVSQVNAAPRTPSQALPQMFQRPSGLDYYDFKKQDKVIPELPQVQIQQQPEIGVEITPRTMIILAPKELQKVIDIKKYQTKIIGVPQNVSNLYDIALEIEKDFNQNGFPLVRVILPAQELEPEQATIVFKVIDGFIEKLDLSKVPRKQVLRTYSYLKPLIKKKAITLKQIERQLLLAGNSAGLSLTSTLIPGQNEGGTQLVIEAEQKTLSGGLTFDNSQSNELGRQQGQARAVISSSLGLGETISLFGLARPTFKGMKGAGADVPIRAGGLSLSVPVGNRGLTTGISYMESMTRPGADVESLQLEANLKSATTTASFPLIYQRNTALYLRGSINWTDEVQHTSAGGADEDLSHDRITAARLGASFNTCFKGCLGIDAEISKGLAIGSRSSGQVGEGTPLSRSTANSNFTHYRLSTSYSVSPFENFIFKVNWGGQYTMNDLLNSEQITIAGENRLSGLTSGAISGDEAWYARGQLNRNIQLSENLIVSPYVYTAGGTAYLNEPTATERSATSAKAVGVGLEISGGDDYFFDKNISAKVEYSKNWATGNIEHVSDTRLNKRQMLVTMAMRF